MNPSTAPPLKVMIILDMVINKRGGIEEYLLALSQRLNSEGGKAYIVVPDCTKEFLKIYEDAGATVLRIPQHHRSFQYKLQLVRALRSHKPDVAVLNFFPVKNLISAIARYAGGVPCIYVDHHSGVGLKHPWSKQAILNIFNLFSMGPCAKVIAVSNFVKQRQIEFCNTPENKVEVVYNGVRGASSEERKRGPALRKELGIAPETLVVMGVGQLIREKGFHTLIEALAQVIQKHPEPALILVGEGRERKALEDLARSQGLKNVHFLGRRNDVQALHCMADIVACPSVWAEAFGLTIAEAMINSRPIIGSRMGGIPELIIDGVDGLLIHPESVTELAAALDKLLSSESLRQRLGATAGKKASEIFHLDRMVSQMLKIFQEVRRH